MTRKKLYAIIMLVVVVCIVGVVLYTWLWEPAEEDGGENGGEPEVPIEFANITGTITDENTGFAIEGAEVEFVRKSMYFTTASDGIYSFSIHYQGPDNYTIRVEKAGYETKTSEVHVTEATEYTVDFVLRMSGTNVYLVPSEIALSTSEVSVGHRFNVTAWVSNVDDLMGFQVALYYDTSMLNMTNAWLPTWNSSYVLYEQTGMPLEKYGYFDSWGYGFLGFTGFSGVATPFSGTGTLGVFEFEIVAAPSTGGSLTSNLIISPENSPLNPNLTPPRVLYETKLKDSAGDPISFAAMDGNYEYIG
ncbi:MAG: carboxypeptidase regulatory-like domain-containing protein [Candidatus Bathyarchaeota archaeon]|nr:carboxypeptidase regulatory-like domain-containing protein [Candidatus Bathyarchaeota archaeon]